jgi:hypothetical protein
MARKPGAETSNELPAGLREALAPDSYGSWERQGELVVCATSQAPWRRLVAVLDQIAEAEDTPGTVPAIEEADAIVACCWLYGSYAYMLTQGRSEPRFKSGDVSRITDSEMKRINIEFSAGLAAWLEVREQDPNRVERRTRAALRLLRMPWTKNRSEMWYDLSEKEDEYPADLAAPFIALGRENPLTFREEANYAVNACYRNGPIEDVHGNRGGRALSSGELLGAKRLYARDVTRIGGSAARRLAIYLVKRDGSFRSLIAGLMRARKCFEYPDGWSVTEETADVRYRTSDRN